MRLIGAPWTVTNSQIHSSIRIYQAGPHWQQQRNLGRDSPLVQPIHGDSILHPAGQDPAAQSNLT